MSSELKIGSQFKDYLVKPVESLTGHPWLDQASRVVDVALPVLTNIDRLMPAAGIAFGAKLLLNSALRLTLDIQKGDSQKIISTAVKTAVFAVALVGTIFAHPTGVIIVVSMSAILETAELAHHIWTAQIESSLLNTVKIANSGLLIGALLKLDPRITIASLAGRILYGLYSYHREMDRGNQLEAGGELLSCQFRVANLSDKTNKYLKT